MLLFLETLLFAHVRLFVFLHWNVFVQNKTPENIVNSDFVLLFVQIKNDCRRDYFIQCFFYVLDYSVVGFDDGYVLFVVDFVAVFIDAVL